MVMNNNVMVFRWVVVVLLLAGNLCAAEFYFERYAYTVTNGAVKITAYADTINSFVDLQLPGTIDGMPVRHIGSNAFASIFLNSISMPDSIASIGDHAFVDNPSLSSFFIGTNVTSIGKGIFVYCTNLSYITVAESNPAYTSPDGVLFDKNMSVLMHYPSNRSGIYTVPEGVVSIANGAFVMSFLSGITFSDTVLTIGDGAFSESKQLESVDLGNGIAQVGDGAFFGCSMLTEIALPASLTTLGQAAFWYCAGLTNLSVHASNHVFTSIDGILFNADVTELIQYPPSKEGNAYTVPSSVTRLGYGAMSLASNLISIVMSSNVVSIRKSVFSRCSGLQSITIPDSVTTLGDSVFFECINLTSVVIGESVSAIGDYAFWKCTGLTGVYFRGDAPTLGTNVFLDATPTIYYLEGASGFGETFGGRPTAVWTP